jgi:hypothetical protein
VSTVVTREKAVECFSEAMVRVFRVVRGIDSTDFIDSMVQHELDIWQSVGAGLPQQRAELMAAEFERSLKLRFHQCIQPLSQSRLRRQCVRYALPPVEAFRQGKP